MNECLKKYENNKEELDKQWLWFHFHICEKPKMLGYSNHVLYIARKLKEEK